MKAAKEIIVQTAFELAPSQRMEVEKTVTNTLHLTTEFQFKIAPELIGGIELNANGYKIGWNISEYLFSIKKTIEELIESKEKGSSINKKVHKDAKE